MNKYMIVTPAYGRKYKTLADAKTDWYEGLDFRVGLDGPYCSQRDENEIRAEGFIGVQLYTTGVLETFNG